MNTINYAERIIFHPDQQIMEVDFSNLTFDMSKSVNTFYDEVDRQLAETGQKWFFLVNYLNCRILSEAWIAFSHRGKKTNLAHSLGSVRFAASGDTSGTILEKSKEENFDPNLFPSRASAVAHIEELRNQIPAEDYQRVIAKEAVSDRALDDRVTFHDDLEIMEADFSDYTFASSADVNAFYDVITSKIAETGRSWYFMVNYQGTEILPDAWYQWAMRSKKLNAASSMGTVRFNPHEATRLEIMKRAKADDADPNLFGSRDDALARIVQLRSSAKV